MNIKEFKKKWDEVEEYTKEITFKSNMIIYASFYTFDDSIDKTLTLYTDFDGEDEAIAECVNVKDIKEINGV